nr:RNA-directed DNA polymerase, eukaryota [Tanacetum cinerariifolium]
GIDKTDCYPEDEIRFTKRLLYDNSSPRPPEEVVYENSNTEIESFSPSPIPVEDSDSFMEEIDLTITPNDPMPPSIEDDDDDYERDILILEKLPSNYSLHPLKMTFVGLPTRWTKSVPIKVNIMAWKIKTNALPTRFNLSRRGMDIETITCPICNGGVEKTSNLFFQCDMAKQLMRKISSWWNIDESVASSYEEWCDWMESIRMQNKMKGMLEGVCYGLWWSI